ncbi:MAG: hypothetical protein IJM54_05485 [Thermoguttaceae bacterium]|nr:hypothetical protein [Thermoguttaceae bacterium]
MPTSVRLLLFLLLSSVSFAFQTTEAAQITTRPVAVSYCSSKHFSFKGDAVSNHDDEFCIANAIDGNPDTYACILDDSPTGSDPNAKPAFGSDPATGWVVFDFGKTLTFYGVKITAPRKNLYVPRVVDLACLEDGALPESFVDYASLVADSKASEVLSRNEFPYYYDGKSETKFFEPTRGRYLALNVRSAYDTGRQGYYIYQFAEFEAFATTEEPENVDISSLYIDGQTVAEYLDHDREIKERKIKPFTEARLKRDWLYQDFESDYEDVFRSTASSALEAKGVARVLDELKQRSVDTASFESSLNRLIRENVPGNDPRWAELYWATCSARRQARLHELPNYYNRYVYVKHYVMGGRGGTLAMTADATDSVIGNRGPDWRVGSELMALTVGEDGELSQEVILETETGIIRDPCVSFDGDKIAFAMKKNENDDYHLYILDVATRNYRQITFGKAVADIEPCFLSNGDLIFSSTRCAQSAPCWWSDVTNLYTCDSEGRYLRRLGFDQAHTFSPQILENGQIVYCRWEYNDRGPIFNEPLFVMNPDGTAQTEYYGNDSFTPTSIIHARGIPGTDKLVAIASGHHCDQTGKPIVIDRKLGTQEGAGLEYISPEKPFDPEINDRFGCDGPLYQYPYALDDNNFLMSFFPEGGVNGRERKYDTPFGIYWFDRKGARELLVFDPTISSGQISPLAPREKPFLKSSSVDYGKDFGIFFLQDVYVGPGLEGIPRGTIKKLRIVGLEYRATGTTFSYNKYYGQVTTPISICNGSWDVKHVLGTVDVEEDGSACFYAPARTPLYFQALDDSGRVVQTMRSWALVLPNETFGCVGCHEDKNTNYFTSEQKTSVAASKEPQNIQPFYREGEEPIPEFLTRATESQRKAWRYLSVCAPQGADRPRGFSYIREIQPIWDEHCVVCHAGQASSDGRSAPISLLGNVRKLEHADIWEPEYTFPPTKQYLYTQNGKDLTPGREFSESYLNLTKCGKSSDYVDGFLAPSDPTMLKPYSYGSSRSPLLKYLEPSHYGVALSQEEKDKVKCWIDLCVPFCGSYLEANSWDKETSRYMSRRQNELREIYLFREAKRLRAAEIELEHLARYLEAQKAGVNYKLSDFPVYDLGGIDVENAFIADLKAKASTVPIYGAAEGVDSRGGSNVVGNPRRNLAANPNATTFELTSYPYATSNSHWKYLDATSPKAAIDGDSSKNSPYWKPNRRTDLWLKVEFGRPVVIDEATITFAFSEGQTKGWKNAALVFDDGSEVTIDLEQSSKPQNFKFDAKTTSSVSLQNLTQDFPLSDVGISEIEYWGIDASTETR